VLFFFFFFQAEDGIRDKLVTGVQTCALPISARDGSARRAILRVVYPDAVAGAGLDDHFMAGSDELANTLRHQADAILMNLDFPRSEERRVGKECRSRWSPEE